MDITKVQITLYDSGKTKGFASITFDDEFVVTGFKVLEGPSGLWVANPNSKQKEEYKDTAFPITQPFRQVIQTKVLEQYHAKQGTYEPQVEVVQERPTIDVSEDDLPF